MGIRGLLSFFTFNRNLSKPHELHNTPVIIDGKNLVYKLFFSNNINWTCGGDFHSFEVLVKHHFSSFLQCGIRPIVIFDGATDKSYRKSQTIMKRHLQRLECAQKAAVTPNHFSNSGLYPRNADVVFKDVLSEMGIAFATSDFEADEQFPALARHYKCPVLSGDGEFYLFDLPYGFVNLEQINMNPNGFNLHNRVLKCRIYYRGNFLSRVPGLDKDLLPLLGILLGNDYIDSSVCVKFFSRAKLSQVEKFPLAYDNRHDKIIRVLGWLRHKDWSTAIAHILACVPDDQRKQVNNTIDQVRASYNIQKCNLMSLLDGLDTIEVGSEMTTLCGQPLPSWFVRNFNSGVLPSFFLNAIFHRKMTLPVTIENSALESAHRCSRPIREALYGIILRHSCATSKECLNKKCQQCVSEFNRDCVWEDVHHVRIGLPMLEELPMLNRKQSREIVSRVLEESSDCFSRVPPFLRLLVGIIRYWLRTCKNPTPRGFVDALILNIIDFSITSGYSVRTVSSVQVETAFHAQSLKSKESYFSSVGFLIFFARNIVPLDTKRAIQKLQSFMVKLNENRTLDVDVVHSFNQLQSCIAYAIHLNRLLGSPFLSTKIHRSTDGSYVHDLTVAIESSSCPKGSFVSNLWEELPHMHQLYLRFKEVLLGENFPDTAFTIPVSRRETDSFIPMFASGLKI